MIARILVTALQVGLLAGSWAHAANWTVTDIGTLSPTTTGTFSAAQGLNDLGQVVGESITASGARHAFLWSASRGMVDLGELPGGENFSLAAAINGTGPWRERTAATRRRRVVPAAAASGRG